MEDTVGLKINKNDNVAVVFAENAKKGVRLNVTDHKGNVSILVLLSDIPYGHKAAVASIKKGSPIIKYGETMGIATTDIEAGEHVHVHNADSQRGRGDIQD
ncbi:MAG TPA: UxaA family hydrolase [Bacillota bacterium]|nr:UxaA family hydrolase [Bacillota bacterium]HPL53041.1 UxaA family hydrolase [Bacillota bacterium]